jgi:glycosyltransferase involved in cell wall biosynthesis
LTKREISGSLPENVEKIEGAWKTQELTDSEVRTLYQRAKIVVVPLRETLQPSGQSVALQAMACGKPVVITRTKGLWSAAHLHNWENIIFVKPGDLQQLVSVLETLLSDDLLCEQIGENARKYVLHNGNIEDFSKRLEARSLECR